MCQCLEEMMNAWYCKIMHELLKAEDRLVDHCKAENEKVHF